MVVWTPADEGKIVNSCQCGGTIRISAVLDGEIRKECDTCSITVEHAADTEVPG